MIGKKKLAKKINLKVAGQDLYFPSQAFLEILFTVDVEKYCFYFNEELTIKMLFTVH